MELDAARAVLGLGHDLSTGDVEQAFRMKREAVAAREATAPTENLRAKYRQSLEEIDQARQALLATLRPAAPNLTHTQMGDLPAAQPLYTQSGVAGGAQRVTNLLQPGQILAQRYEIRERIGIGGMGAVYRAFDRNRHEEIAVKVLLPHLLSHSVARERFLAEAKIASSLSHPNIVNVFDVQRDGENDFLTMELLHGQTLRQWMTARKAARQPFTVSEAVQVGTAIASALGYAHKQTVHRDVKPENVWVEDDGNFKLMDFGIARLLSTSQLTQTTTAMGTAYYMAPEQLRAAKSVDGRADQYALGVIMYEMISGDIPAGRIKALNAVRKGVPRGLSDAVDRSLEPQPEARFKDMAAFAKALSSRGSVVSGGAVKGVALVLAVAGVIGLGVVAWPQIKGLLPDRTGEERARVTAIQTQGVIETLLKRIETAERDIDTQFRDAKSTVDRYDGMLRMARNEAEKQDLSRQLQEAQRQMALWTEVRDTSSTWVFQSNALANVRGQLALGTTALRENRYEEAARELGAAQASVEQMLLIPKAVQTAIEGRWRYEEVVENTKRLTAQEKKDSAPILATARTTADSAKQATLDGKFDEAARLYGNARSQAQQDLNAFIDQMVSAYSAFAEKAMNANRLNEAEIAVKRAKALAAMKVAVQ